MSYYDAIENQTKQAELVAPMSETLLQRYQRQLKEAEERVLRLHNLVTLLEKNPETSEILQLMGRL